MSVKLTDLTMMTRRIDEREIFKRKSIFPEDINQIGQSVKEN